MDTNDRYTKLCDDIRALMSEIGYSVPCEPEELMAVLAYDAVALRPWCPKTKDQIEAVSPVLTSLDRRVFLVNDGNRNMKLYLDPMYTREIQRIYRFAVKPAETGTLYKRTLREGSEKYVQDAKDWLAGVKEFLAALNEELDELEEKLPEEMKAGLTAESKDAVSAANEEILARIDGTIATLVM